MGSRVGALLLSPSGVGLPPGLYGLGSRNNRPDEERRGGGEWEKGRKTHLLGPRGSSKEPSLCKTLSPQCVSARRQLPLPISALGGLWSPFPSQAGTGLLVPPSRSPAGLGITRNLGSEAVLPRPLPARLAPRGTANRLVREVGEGCPERETEE